MTRAEAIEILRDTPIAINSSREDDIHTLYAMAQNMAIEALQQEPDWIPVSERLPEIGDTVIISGKMRYKDDKDYEYFVDVAVYEPSQEFSTFNDWFEGQDEFEILAWQSLPEPYEERDGE